MALNETQLQTRIERTIVLVRQGFVSVEDGTADIERFKKQLELVLSIK